MADFSQDIWNFQKYGTYTYKFDSVGNMTFDSSSANFNQVYVSLPLQNPVYDKSKIESMYNVEFEEFVPQTAQQTQEDVNTLQQQLDTVQQENITLKSQLDSVIAQNETSGSVADKMAIKQVILELRKTLGQGRVETDFSEDFPYTPIIKNKNT